MEPIPVSGLYYPNKIANIALKALEDVMGKNGVNAILNLANLQHLIDHYPPPNSTGNMILPIFLPFGVPWKKCMVPEVGVGWRLEQDEQHLPRD